MNSNMSAISEAGLAEYRDHARLPFVDRLAHHLDESVQLGLAADHARLDALHTARGEAEPLPLGSQDRVDAHRLPSPAHRDRLLLAHVEDPAHVAVGVVRYEDRSRSRELLEPAGDVHRVPHGGLAPRAHAADENHSGVDPDANAQRATRELQSADLLWIPSAAETARSGSSSRAPVAPHNAMTASPMCLSIDPPCSRITPSTRRHSSFMASFTSSASRVSARK